jgi:hypothetical protein
MTLRQVIKNKNENENRLKKNVNSGLEALSRIGSVAYA